MAGCTFLSYAQHTVKEKVQPKKYVQPRYFELPVGAIRPNGWLLHQAQIMAANSTGHLDEVYNKLKNDNGWLGGKGDGWEETPYWLDGAVPLAYQLNDENLKKKVSKYVNWCIDNQRPSGYFGPVTKAERDSGKVITPMQCNSGEDWWPKMIMLKVMHQYYTATLDKRVIPFLTNYFRYQLNAIRYCPVGKWTEWATSRGSENMLIAQWLYGVTKERFLLELSALIKEQSFPWSDLLGNRDWVINAAAFQNNDKWMQRHGVNVGMAIKEPVINYQRTGDPLYLKQAKTGFNDLMTLHGLPIGIFSADEDLHGNDPGQGAELCAVVEAMYSLEQATSITGDIGYMDALERMAFNALPSQTTDDYNKKQYFQVANQVQISRGVFNFSLPFERKMNNVLGMRSGYTCCLANMHQGWPKFTSHLWYGTAGNGLAALHFAPNTTTAKVGNKQAEVMIREVTDYPFSDQINFEITTAGAVDFPFELRIPSWCKQATLQINGQAHSSPAGGQIVRINRTWNNNDRLTLQLPMEITTSNWGKNSRAVERGPLVYALKLGERWEEGNDEREGSYYSVFAEGAWNYGLLQSAIREPQKSLQVKQVKQPDSSFIWNLAHAPLEITASAKKIPGWKIANEVAATPVSDRSGLYKGEVANEVETITLVPVGCTKVRIVAFPVVR
ncbi:hypothetical protein EXU57_03130 [Segetibacter sp. 3557_3]|nr:hypothetical protein EXU57_03130 [Segetibacter sp. 3557_3]